MTTSRITDGHADFPFSCTDGTPRQERLHDTALPPVPYRRSNYCIINRLRMLPVNLQAKTCSADLIDGSDLSNL